MSEVNPISIDARYIEQYLHDHIPITRTMEVKVLQADDSVIQLAAPFGPNVNHRGTVFGGSACSLAILSAWTMLFRKLKQQEFTGRIVIQSNQVDYGKPITGDFTAICHSPDSEKWNRFISTLQRWGKGRIQLNSTLYCDDDATGRFEGEYVAITGGEDDPGILL